MGDADSRWRLGLALGVTASFMAVEAAVGLWTGSLALLADAGHMLSDAGGLAVALVAARIAARPRDGQRTLGWKRASVLGATLNASLLLAIAFSIVVEGIGRLGEPAEIQAGPMMVVAAIGLLVNLGMAALLHGGHQHDLNRRAALMHVLGDALGSVGALVAGGLVMTMGWGWADPVASLCIALIIAVGAWRILKEATEVLMMAAPREISFEAVREVMLAEPGVFAVHDLHLWSLAPGAPVLSAHIVVDEEAVAPIVRRRLEDRLRTVLHFEHLTIQVEQNGEMCRCCPTDEVPRPEAAR